MIPNQGTENDAEANGNEVTGARSRVPGESLLVRAAVCAEALCAMCSQSTAPIARNNEMPMVQQLGKVGGRDVGRCTLCGMLRNVGSDDEIKTTSNTLAVFYV